MPRSKKTIDPIRPVESEFSPDDFDAPPPRPKPVGGLYEIDEGRITMETKPAAKKPAGPTKRRKRELPARKNSKKKSA